VIHSEKKKKRKKKEKDGKEKYRRLASETASLRR
jgi:hypothetical protein